MIQKAETAAPLAAEDEGGYGRLSRRWPASLVMIVPLLIVYEAGVLLTDTPPAAAADILHGPFALLGRRGLLVFKAQGVAQLPPAELETSISAHAGGVRICAAHGNIQSLLPMDPAIRVDRAVLEAGMLVLEGQAQVTTSG